MAKPVNLNKVRKARAKEKKRRDADANTAKFGRSKSETARDRAEAILAALRHEAHRREPE